jgi:hypothetical protein
MAVLSPWLGLAWYNVTINFPEIDVWCLIKQALTILFSCLWFIDMF